MSLAENLPATLNTPPDSGLFQRVPHWRLRTSPLNPRKHARSKADIEQLASSIATHGILQNLVVRESEGNLEIAAGEGRWLAVRELISQGTVSEDYEMPVVIRSLSDEDMIEIGLIENIQRNDLHPLDEAEAFLSIYNARTKVGGKKAAAEIVEHLASKVHRSKRYIQKRMRLARDLIPEWRTLLSDGHLSVSIANILTTMPPEEQREELSHWTNDDGTPQIEDIAGLTPSQLDYKWRPMASALFDTSLYTGETADLDGAEYATDRVAFDELQKQAAADLTKKFRAQAKEGDIAFFDTVPWFNEWEFEKQMVDGEPDPHGGVVLVKRPDGSFQLHRGLFKTAHRTEREVKEKKVKAEKAKRVKQANAVPERKPDPRVTQVRAALAKDPTGALAVQLFNDIGDDVIHWIGSTSWPEPEAKKAAIKILADAHGRALPKGAKLLELLLTFTTTTLLKAWAVLNVDDSLTMTIEKPTAAEQLLFAHYGATRDGELALPAKVNKEPKTAVKRPAAKTKPSAKKGKNK